MTHPLTKSLKWRRKDQIYQELEDADKEYERMSCILGEASPEALQAARRFDKLQEELDGIEATETKEEIKEYYSREQQNNDHNT